MGVNQSNIYGDESDYQFGPGALYINTSTGFIPAGYTGATGTGTYIGKCGPIEISNAVTYAEATSIQTGVNPDDHAVSGQKYEFSTTLKQAGIDRLELMVDGFSVERDTDNQPIRYAQVDVVGKRKAQDAFQMTYVSIEEGLELWDQPFRVIDCFKTVPLTSEATVTVDAENFREYAVMFHLYRSDETDYQGRKMYFASREITNP